jgi:hypothetical protein
MMKDVVADGHNFDFIPLFEADETNGAFLILDE